VGRPAAAGLRERAQPHARLRNEPFARLVQHCKFALKGLEMLLARRHQSGFIVMPSLT